MGLCEGRCHYSPVHVLPFHQNSHIVARGNSISLFHPTVAFQQVLRSPGSSCAARMVSFHVFPPVLQLGTRQTAPVVVTFFHSVVAMTSIVVASWLLIMKNLFNSWSLTSGLKLPSAATQLQSTQSKQTGAILTKESRVKRLRRIL